MPGGRPARREQDGQHEQDVAGRRDDHAERDDHRGQLASLRPHLERAADDARASFAPDGREGHQRGRIGDDERQRRCESEGQGAVERIR